MTEVAVRTVGLSKAYGRTLALDAVSLEIAQGEVFGYLGPNGAGKTTTIRLLLGLLRPTAGSAEVLGEDCWHRAVAVHRLVGYVPGETALYDHLTGAEHVAYVSRLRGSPAPARTGELAERLGLDLSRRIRQLSKGNRQKLALLLALLDDPPVLVLDEPTTGLDPLVQLEFHALLREHADRGGATLLSSHVLGEVQRVADRVGVLRGGRLVAVERLDTLRRASLHHVVAQFAGDVPATAVAALPGVRDLLVEDRTLRCSAPQSALDGLLKVVSGREVVDFECAEADLDETFLAYYGGDHDHGVPA